MQKWTKHPPLQEMVLIIDVFEWAPNSMFNLKQQHKWVSEIIFPHFPSLRRCQFEKSVDWIYFSEESEWKPQVVQDEARSLVRRLNNRAYEDYRGFFEHLLDNGGYSVDSKSDGVFKCCSLFSAVDMTQGDPFSLFNLGGIVIRSQ